MAVGFFHYQREDEQCKRSGTGQSADDDDGQGSLALAAYAVADGRRKQSQGGHHCGHQHGADAGVHAFLHSHRQRMTLADEVPDVHDHDDPVLDADAKETDEADAGRDGEVEARQEQNQYASHGGKRHIGQHEGCITRIAKEHIQNAEDKQDADGHDVRQTVGGTLLILEVTAPFYFVPLRQRHRLRHLFTAFVNRTAYVPVAYGELDSTIAHVIFTIDNQRPGDGPDGGQFADGNHLPVVGGYLDFADGLGIVAERPRVAHHEIELALLLVHLRCRLAADSHLDDALHIVLGNAIACQPSLVDVNLQFRLSDILDDTQVGDTSDGLHGLVDFGCQPLRLSQVLAIDLGDDSPFHTADSLLHIVRDGL